MNTHTEQIDEIYTRWLKGDFTTRDGFKDAFLVGQSQVMSAVIAELELLAADMVCGTDQERVFRRIEVLKQEGATVSS